MDVLIARFNDTWGYISTGKDKSYGFEWGYKDIIDKLEKKDKNFTYATPEELALSEHQREWTNRDRIYYNKLKFYYDRYNYQMTQVLIFKNGVER
jgi:hypothetical protein